MSKEFWFLRSSVTSSVPPPQSNNTTLLPGVTEATESSRASKAPAAATGSGNRCTFGSPASSPACAKASILTCDQRAGWVSALIAGGLPSYSRSASSYATRITAEASSTSLTTRPPARCSPAPIIALGRCTTLKGSNRPTESTSGPATMQSGLTRRADGYRSPSATCTRRPFGVCESVTAATVVVVPKSIERNHSMTGPSPSH